jgi:predicted N-acetyltransferase YhbS
MAIEIRELTSSDFKALLDVWPSTAGQAVGPKPTIDALKHLLQRFANLSVVATDEGELIGAMLVSRDRQAGVLYQLLLAKPDPEQHLTKMLVDKALMKLACHGVRTCQLTRVDGSEDRPFWDLTRWHACPELAAADEPAPTSSAQADPPAEAPLPQVAADNAKP